IVDAAPIQPVALPLLDHVLTCHTTYKESVRDSGETLYLIAETTMIRRAGFSVLAASPSPADTYRA
ncbi:MAG: hypothetical protein ACREJU_04515, partial [Nitrospiraceae bacterium]